MMRRWRALTRHSEQCGRKATTWRSRGPSLGLAHLQRLLELSHLILRSLNIGQKLVPSHGKDKCRAIDLSALHYVRHSCMTPDERAEPVEVDRDRLADKKICKDARSDVLREAFQGEDSPALRSIA